MPRLPSPSRQRSPFPVGGASKSAFRVHRSLSPPRGRDARDGSNGIGHLRSQAERWPDHGEGHPSPASVSGGGMLSRTTRAVGLFRSGGRGNRNRTPRLKPATTLARSARQEDHERPHPNRLGYSPRHAPRFSHLKNWRPNATFHDNGDGGGGGGGGGGNSAGCEGGWGGAGGPLEHARRPATPQGEERPAPEGSPHRHPLRHPPPRGRDLFFLGFLLQPVD